MHRTPSPYPLRKVTEHLMSDAWWDMLGRDRTWYLTLECGHAQIRRAVMAPKRVRCNGCPPRN